jgi:tRNA pseudouridine65 synthase
VEHVSEPILDTNAIELRVLYRDDSLIAVMKPSGLAVHRGWSHDAVTAADIVRDRIVGARVFGLHRLDRATSGVLLFALNSATARTLQASFNSANTRKRYIALVRGPLKEAQILDHPIRTRGGNERVAALTEFIPLAHVDRWSLVEARPRTGRLHQIRKHLKHLNCPVIGDVKYGKGDVNRLFREQFDLHRLALHCCEISVEHNNEVLKLQAPLPQDLVQPFQSLGILNELKNESFSFLFT